jgi:hypothetical protein
VALFRVIKGNKMKYTTVLTKEDAQKSAVQFGYLKGDRYITLAFFSKESTKPVITLVGFKSYSQVMKFKECLVSLGYHLVDDGCIDLVERERLEEWLSIANPDVMRFAFTWDLTIEDLLKGL